MYKYITSLLEIFKFFNSVMMQLLQKSSNSTIFMCNNVSFYLTKLETLRNDFGYDYSILI